MLEHRMSEMLSEFARTVATDFPIQRIRDHLVHRIVYIRAGAVRLMSRSSLRPGPF